MTEKTSQALLRQPFYPIPLRGYENQLGGRFRHDLDSSQFSSPFKSLLPTLQGDLA
jgi:hypothetical protein